MKVKRLISILIDYMVICMIVLPITWIIKDILTDPGNSFEIIGIDNNLFISIQYIFIWLLFSCKDFIFKNISIGKKRCGLKILTKNDKKPTNLILFFRNIFMFIYPFEIIMIIILGQKLGDIIFKTKVIEN